MVILDYLGAPHAEDGVEVEYRLVSSGALYRQGMSGDWSLFARTLVEEPFVLVAASENPATRPQELALWFTTQRITVERGPTSLGYVPDEEIASDLAALLSLYLRRLVTVHVKVSQNDAASEGESSVLKYRPYPILTDDAPRAWRGIGEVSIHRPDQPVERISYDPLPRAVDPQDLLSWLDRLRNCAHADALVRAARLYSAALELLPNQSQVAYLLLVSAIETASQQALADWRPSEEEMLATKGSLLKEARRRDLSVEVAKAIALAACSADRWAGRKFRKFILDHVPFEAWGDDDLFPNRPMPFAPEEDEFEGALKRIYDVRSGALHEGAEFPFTSGYGISTSESVHVVIETLTEESVFPPLPWFERIVSRALNNHIARTPVPESKEEQ